MYFFIAQDSEHSITYFKMTYLTYVEIV
ncbi:protein of unknown function [Trichlorobacter ammonificans]|uniref:Uncharacterized protein n=1 Tax=Trichlorobacter ammonificans TaxID=2916410 RepID=A0ABN8HL28_9BACT|nr:protein of unknown function [Trichlorobacter ammonificans]